MKKIPLGAKLLNKFLADRVAAQWAITAEIEESYLCHLRKGRRRPSIQVAARIERASGGAVPVAAWAQ